MFAWAIWVISCVAAGGSALVLGVSSFGAQGSNAHALVRGSCEPAAVSRASDRGKMPWRRVSCWAVPLAQVRFAGSTATAVDPEASTFQLHINVCY